MKIINPRTGGADYEIAPLDEAAVHALAARMRAAQPGWEARSVEDRGAILRRFADTIARHRDAIADALILDTGRAAISLIEVDGIARSIARWAATAPALIAGATIDNHQTVHPTITTSTRLVPYGLVGVISPWNFPLTLALIDAIPALMAGCAVLVKPSEVTPRFIRPLMAALAEVPELTDVMTLIEGDGATGAAIVPCVDYVAFTGSVATGRKVGKAAARCLVPASLELGGKDPMIILASADPVKAAAVALRASIVNTGQACQSIERVYVDRLIAEPFLTALVKQAEAVRFNYPDIDVGDIGPFIFGKQAQIVQDQLDDAVAKGARILTGGTVETLGGGQYLRPTVLVDVQQHMKVIGEETFGPVIPVTVTENAEEAICLGNEGIFGLSAAVIAGSVDEAEAVGARLRAGAVSINDGSLTSMVWEAEKSSFGLSGIGPSRMGDSGLLRFFRRQAMIRQSGNPLLLAAYAEGAPNG
jgi:acyl-CoA reductase-like NAD-dependent aldehyde dehydrogenase